MQNYQTLWSQCLSVISDIVPDALFNTWFKPIIPLSYESNKFTIQVPSQFFYEYLEDRYADVLKVTIDRVIGVGTILNYRVMVDTSTGSTVDYPTEKRPVTQASTSKSDASKVPAPYTQTAPQDLDSNLNPKYSFENFFEGRSNQFARAVAKQVTDNPGKTAFNPLFVYGPSGVGKTHLCHAIGSQIKELHPELKVLYVSAHVFRMQYTDATRKNTANDFMFFYQNMDVLILDDIQEMIGMDKTQNTFFHIFNHLHQLNKQLILTSDKAPVDMRGMEERMITRLRWGLTAELSRPDFELRKKILENKALLGGIKISNDIIEYIAENVTDNVRDLEGILVSLHAFSVIQNQEIDMVTAKRILSQAVMVLDKKKLSVQTIQDKVCSYFNIETPSLLANSRKREIVQARQITMYLSKKYTDKSLTYIGKVVGDKDHATVLHSVRLIKEQIEVNKSFRALMEDLEGKLCV